FEFYRLIFRRLARILYEMGIVEAAQPEYEIALDFLSVLTAQLFTTRGPPCRNTPEADQFTIATE
ncbi:MAG: hypothetical protein WA239_20515, partial [Candidatus Sulfotelmatobacter sp.]